MLKLSRILKASLLSYFLLLLNSCNQVGEQQSFNLIRKGEVELNIHLSDNVKAVFYNSGLLFRSADDKRILNLDLSNYKVDTLVDLYSLLSDSIYQESFQRINGAIFHEKDSIPFENELKRYFRIRAFNVSDSSFECIVDVPFEVWEPFKINGKERLASKVKTARWYLNSVMGSNKINYQPISSFCNSEEIVYQPTLLFRDETRLYFPNFIRNKTLNKDSLGYLSALSIIELNEDNSCKNGLTASEDEFAFNARDTNNLLFKFWKSSSSNLYYNHKFIYKYNDRLKSFEKVIGFKMPVGYERVLDILQSAKNSFLYISTDYENYALIEQNGESSKLLWSVGIKDFFSPVLISETEVLLLRRIDNATFEINIASFSRSA